MHRFYFMTIFVCYGCGLFNDKYDEGIKKPTPQESVFVFPGVANLSWLQERTNNNVQSSVHNIMVAEKKGDILDSLYALILIYRSSQETFRDMIFVEKLKFNSKITDTPQVSDSILFEKNQSLNSDFGHVFLLSAFPNRKVKFSGFYHGEFRTYLSQKIVSEGSLIGFVDYLGNLQFILDDTEINSIEGIVSSDDICVFKSKRIDKSVISTGDLKLLSSSAVDILFETPIINSTQIDSITIQMNEVL
jgi:hypothetical protein